MHIDTRKPSIFFYLLISFMCVSFLSNRTQAATIIVGSIPALQTAINNSNAGDEILLASGTYLNASITINKNNISVKSQIPGGVYLNGTQEININGNGNTFSGFHFTSGNIGSGEIININGNSNTLSEINFNGYRAKKYIHINGGTQYNTISNCNIENKPADAEVGCLIQITTTPAVPGYHTIRYCSFQNFPGPGGDYGNEPIRIGLSTEMNNASRTIVEYCYFENVGLGDGESISLKSCENVCRYNTFTNNPKGEMVFRHGYRNVAYGNFFINNSGGIRIKEGGDHYIYNNYFSTGSITSVRLQYEAEYPLNNINFLNNTFIDGSIDLGTSSLSNVTFANNIFNKSSGSIFRNPIGNEKWIGNIYSGAPGITITNGMTNVNPELALNSNGYYGLTASSPAINAALEGFPAILDIANTDDDPSLLLDIKGLPRPANITLKDVGCEEFNAVGTVTNRPLKLADVGPNYLKLITSLLHPTSNVYDFQITINPASKELMLNVNFDIINPIYVSLYNTKGELFNSFTVRNTNKSDTAIKIANTLNLKPGLYIINLKAEEFIKSKKVILL
jgi:hypothetical protein